MAKVKSTSKSQVQTTRARPGQVLAASVLAATQDMRVALGRDDTLREAS